MKTFNILSLLAIFSAASATAQVGDTPIMSFDSDAYSLGLVGFAEKGNQTIFANLEDEVNIYNSDFELIKNWSVPSTTMTETYKIYSRQTLCYANSDITPLNGPGAMVIAKTREWNNSFWSSTLDEAKQYITNNGLSITYENVVDNTYYFYCDFFNFENHGTKYPTIWFTWDSGTQLLTEHTAEYTEVGSFSITEAAGYCPGYTQKTIKDETYFFPPEEEYYYAAYNTFGATYPADCYHYSAEGALTHYREITYTINENSGSNWELKNTWEQTASAGEIEDIETLGEDKDMTITQNFFNSDANYEYILPIYEQVASENYESEYCERANGYIELKVVAETGKKVGFKVMNDAGTELSRTKLDNNSYGYYYFYTIQAGGGHYLAAETDYVTYIYAVDSESGSIKQVESIAKHTVSPRIAKRSTPIIVTFGSIGKAARQIVVSSTEGRTMKNFSIDADQTSAVVDTSGFPAGMYIISIVENGQKTEHSKVIIR